MDMWLRFRRLALKAWEGCAAQASKETATEVKPSAANREYTRSFLRIKLASTETSKT